jgi:hypothetical protein
MIKVKFFSSFCDSQNCINVYKRVTELIDNHYYGKNVVFTTEDDYTHAIIVNTAMPQLTCKKENVIGLAFEPPCYLNLTYDFVIYAMQNIGKYYIGDNTSLPSPFINHHGFMWYIPFPRMVETKNNFMSIIFSNKKDTIGHKYRHLLVQTILRFGLPIDIYGRGCTSLSNINDSRLKGQFNDEEPYKNYKFSIAIENVSLPDYISEKLINCLVYGTTPIYYGAINTDKYFPDKYIRLTGKLKDDLELLRNIISNPESYIKQWDRYEILKKMNLIEHLDNVFCNTQNH